MSPIAALEDFRCTVVTTTWNYGARGGASPKKRGRAKENGTLEVVRNAIFQDHALIFKKLPFYALFYLFIKF